MCTKLDAFLCNGITTSGQNAGPVVTAGTGARDGAADAVRHVVMHVIACVAFEQIAASLLRVSSCYARGTVFLGGGEMSCNGIMMAK
jgi:hypothetical protein